MLLNPIQALNPNPNHRLTLAPIQLQSRRARARTHIVHAQESEMRSVGGHEDTASHANANHLVIETAAAVTVQDVNAPNNCARWQCYYHLTCPTASCTVSYTRYSMPSNHTLYCIRETVRQSNGPNDDRLVRVYRSGIRYHKHTASDALVFMINATMSLSRSELNRHAEAAPQQ